MPESILFLRCRRNIPLAIELDDNRKELLDYT